MQTNKKKKTPAFANWLISKFIDEALLEEFFGDLKEIYEDRISSKGKFYAKFMYWVDVLHLLMGFTSLKLFRTQNNPTTMYKHYLIIAVRNLLKNRVYSLINVFSVAIGMGVCLLIYQYIRFESSFDEFHSDVRHTYRICTEDNANGVNTVRAYTGYSIGVKAKEAMPEIKNVVRMHRHLGGAIITNPEQNKPFYELPQDLLYVDPTFFDIFNFRLLSGHTDTALAGKFDVVITEKTAQKYFGSENPLGKVLNMGGAIPLNFTVTGVVENPPANSHLQFAFLFPLENLLEFFVFGLYKGEDGWKRYNFATYICTNESVNPLVVEEKLNQIVSKYKGEWMAHENIIEKARLQHLNDIHLKSAGFYSDMSMNNGDIEDIRLFSIVAVFILLIAWVNCINLSTARSMHRAKEVGIRKSIGAFQKQLVGQFIIESFVINLVSGILSLAIAFVSFPLLNKVLGKELQFTLLYDPLFWLLFLAIIFSGSLLTGLYPAFILSSFKPVSMLGSGKGSAKSGGFVLRRCLITFQFLISLFLIASTYLVYKQIAFMENQELNMNIENIVVLRGPDILQDRPNMQSTIRTFKEKLLEHHAISAAGSSNSVPGKGFNGEPSMRRLGEPEGSDKFGRVLFAASDFPTTYDLKFTSGSAPTRVQLATEEGFVVINEEAVKVFGLGSEENALRERLFFKNDTFKITGVVKNFHWHSLREGHKPYVLEFYDDSKSYFSFKINPADVEESIALIQSTYNTFFPGNPFDYFFLEEEVNRQYQSDVQFRNLFFAFTVLAIFLACIGLFALVSYSASLKTKEIGIRKVLGAGVSSLMVMLSKEYLILLAVANLLAIPTIFYWGNSWLENYAFKTNLGVELFIIPGIVICIIALATVSYRTYFAAQANPVDSLRIE